MKLTLDGISEKKRWNSIGVALPEYDVEAVREKTGQSPQWVHVGIGNIFRVFIGGIADELITGGSINRGIICVETYDYEVVDQIYKPHDNFALSVILHKNGDQEMRVLGSMTEAIKADYSDEKQWKRLKEIFTSRALQMVSFTITEKGYNLRKSDGTYWDYINQDIEQGPEQAKSVIAVIASMLWNRFQKGACPIALVSMDNCSHNGELLKQAVYTIVEEWFTRGMVTSEFVKYVKDEDCVAFPWSMIDKITPRPDEAIARHLEDIGIENMMPITTSKRTYIAPFVNAEPTRYLVIEDHFPNGRPPLEVAAGVYLTDRDTVIKSEQMKVCSCLNPVHSALGPLEVVLGIRFFADGLKCPELLAMGKQIAYGEGLPVSADPLILSPKAFIDELFQERFSNEYLGDTNLRLSTDVSQGVGVRFGVTINEYVNRYGTAEQLTAIPFGIAGWLRYLLGIDDEGKPYEVAPDPLYQELASQLKEIKIGDPSSLKDQLKNILSDKNMFFCNLYEAGIGEKIEHMLREMISGTGAARAALCKYF